ncbi:mannonate dehydratase [Pedobacter sp. AW31-3R]|uniref:mannonate dehydratase n=1 Tax=Pedobacter sp. AW31-3R TaxID=3445781 RepID=UPI003FA17134
MVKFEQSMRWFGENDPVKLSDIRQAGCSAVVTALHHIPVGEVWPVEEIRKRKHLIEEAGMCWHVVESLPVHEGIKTKNSKFEELVGNYKQSLKNLGSCGIKVVTYNFMPVLDWMRTDPAYPMPGGGKALRFERLAFLVFDLFLLNRPGAEKEYTASEIRQAAERFDSMSAEEKAHLFKSTLLGLPGSDEPFTPALILKALQTYAEIDRHTLKVHLHAFLQEIIPQAEEVGIKMAIHPDDPPYSILGLPRIVSTAEDLAFIAACSPSSSNGFCYCTGSLSILPSNDLEGIISDFGRLIHFVHLRNTTKDTAGNFYEAAHLDGDVDMYRIMKKLIELMQETQVSLPLRPDHGHQLLDDLQKKTYPGYSAIGRLKGLAELRGLELGITGSGTG